MTFYLKAARLLFVTIVITIAWLVFKPLTNGFGYLVAYHDSITKEWNAENTQSN